MKIIVADDYSTNRLLVSEILIILGHDFIEAENGKQALEALEKYNDIDLVLMDIEMPVMSGFEAMRYIRENLDYPKSQVPIIALTAHNLGLFTCDYSASGFNQMLTKPYSIDKFAALLEEYAKS